MNRPRISQVPRAALAALLCVPAVHAVAAPQLDTSLLRDAVTVDGIRTHQERFQQIADAHGGQRAAGTAGHEASADYVAQVLTDAGYVVSSQAFDYGYFEQLAPATLERTAPTFIAFVENAADGFGIMRFSGSGDVSAPVECVDVMIPPGPVPNTSTSGCEAADFAGFTPGHIAVLQRGSCSFADKVALAESAGAAGVIVFNEGQTGRTDLFLGTLGTPDFTVPVASAAYAVGEALCNTAADVHLAVEALSEVRTSRNIIADTAGAAIDGVVIAGAHLDSTPGSPGIQDNGSGAAALLEVAVQLADYPADVSGLRLAFWSATEAGRLGAVHYVASLPPAQLAEVGAYLNFDAIGSPNYVRFVYDGDGSHLPTAAPAGSADLEALFLDYFRDQGLPTEPTAQLGEGDHLPFFDAGIPVGGLFCGDVGIKTADQAAVYGGTAGEQYDQCYHLACDTFANISLEALADMSDAMAHALALLTIDPCACVDGHVTLCHAPPGRRDRARTKTVGCAALPAHLKHGDHCGPCD